MNNVIAIDGPGGAGKSTVALKLAEKLGYKYLDTGAMYRALTYKILKENININNKEKVIELAQNTKITFTPSKENKKQRILIDNKDVTEHIRNEKIDKNVSMVAQIKGIREYLVKQQQKIAKKGKIIMDGRDIGTNVLPDADFKFYINASLDERARRRFLDEKNKKSEITYEKIKENLIKRDKIDTNRKHSPLKKADDAVEIDTTNLTIKETVDCLLDIITRGE